MNTSTTTKFKGGISMKTLSISFAVMLFILAGCKSSYYSGAYSDDDVYTPASQTYQQTNPGNYTSTQDQNYNDDYYNPNSSSSNTQQYTDTTTGNTYVTNNYYGNNNQFVYDDYYDYAYASRIRRFHNPSYGFGYYDSYYTNTYFYNYDPYFYGTSIYTGYNWWGPSITFSYGWGFGSYYNCGWGSPYWGSPWAMNCYNNWYGYPYYGNNYWWGYNNGYWNGYWNGYNNGYWNGYNNGLYNSYYYNTYDNNSNFYYGHRSTSPTNGGYAGKTSFKESYLSAVSQGTVTGNKINVANHSKGKVNNIDGYAVGKDLNNTNGKTPAVNNISKDNSTGNAKPGNLNNNVGKEQVTQGSKELEKNPVVKEAGADRFTKENNIGNNTNTQSKELPKTDNYSRPNNTNSIDKYTRPETINQQQKEMYSRPENSRNMSDKAQQARPQEYVAPQRTETGRNENMQRGYNYNYYDGYQQNKQPNRNYDYNQYNNQRNNNNIFQKEPQQQRDNNKKNNYAPQQNQQRQNFNQNNNKGGSFDRGSFNKGGGGNSGGSFNSGSNNRGNSGSSKGPR